MYNDQELTKLLKNPEISEFSGDRDEYNQWQKMFYQTIHVQDISSTRKYNYLLKYLSSNVKQGIISGLSRSRADYCLAVNRLEKKYGYDKLRPDSEVESITNMRPIATSDLKRAMEFINKLEGYLSSEELRSPHDISRDIMPAARRILPREWMESYLTWTIELGTAANPYTLVAFLRPHLETKLSLMPLSQQAADSTGKRRPPAPRNARREPNKPSPSPLSPARSLALVGHGETPLECPCCGQNHRVRQCRRFHMDLDNYERRAIVEENRLCPHLLRSHPRHRELPGPQVCAPYAASATVPGCTRFRMWILLRPATRPEPPSRPVIWPETAARPQPQHTTTNRTTMEGRILRLCTACSQPRRPRSMNGSTNPD